MGKGRYFYGASGRRIQVLYYIFGAIGNNQKTNDERKMHKVKKLKIM